MCDTVFYTGLIQLYRRPASSRPRCADTVYTAIQLYSAIHYTTDTAPERPRNAAVTADEADTKKAGDIISTRVRTPKNKGQSSHTRYN